MISEKKIKRNLIKFTATTVFAVLLLVATSILLSFSLGDIKMDSIDTRIEAETDMLSDNISHYIEADFRLLRTVAAILVSSAEEDITAALDEESLKNELGRDPFAPGEFLTIGLYAADGHGARAYLPDRTVRKARMSDLPPHVQQTIRAALQGNEANSSFFFSKEFDTKIYTHAVPVRKNSGIVGAITGTHSVSELKDILNTGQKLNPVYKFFILDKSTNSFIASSENDDFIETIRFQENGEREFFPVFPPEVRERLRGEKDGFFSFTYYDNCKYRAYVKALAFNNLHLLCVKKDLNAEGKTGYSLFLTRIVFAVMSSVIALVILTGYRLLAKYGKELVRITYFDALTQAANLNRFKAGLANVKKNSKLSFCIATLDIKRFKLINEIFGIPAANRLLQIISQVLERSLATGEFFCRENGDIFHLCLLSSSPGEVKERLERIISAIKENLLKVYDYHLQIYAGVAVFAGADKTLETEQMLALTFLALIKAKNDASNPLYFYDETLLKEEKTKNYIEANMERALEEGNFKVYLQPKIDLQTGSLAGAEALVRWEVSNRPVIFPDQFIPLFEENGFCVKLDMYMFEEVCKLLRQWMDAGFEPVPVSVNQSKLMFFEPNYVEDISGIAAKYAIPPGIVTLEILEQFALENTAALNEKITALRAAGFLISMDDFGRAYSSFSAIGSLNIDELKLDRSFLLEAAKQENWRTKIVIDQIVRMARRLHLTVVAEGVETKEDENLVKTLGIDYGQGYYYCRPITAETFTARYVAGTDTGV